MNHYHVDVNIQDGTGAVFSNLCRCAWADVFHFYKWMGVQQG